MAAITQANFKQRLAAFTRSAKSQRDTLQSLLMFAIDHAANNQDEFTCLTQVMNATVEVKSFRTETIKDYVKDLVTNLEYAKLKDNTYGFRKIKKGVPCEYKAPECPWYNFNNKGEVKPDVHPMVQLKSWVTRAKKALSEGKVQDSQEAEATEKALQEITKLLA